MAIVIDDDKLEKLGLDKRVLKQLEKTETKEDKAKITANVNAIENLAKSIELLASKPNATTDLSPILAVLSSTLESQKKVIDLLSKPKKERQWEFSLIRNESGTIQKIKAKEVIAKSINKGA